MVVTPAAFSRARIGPSGGPASTSTVFPRSWMSVASPWPMSRNEIVSGFVVGPSRPLASVAAASVAATATRAPSVRLRTRSPGVANGLRETAAKEDDRDRDRIGRGDGPPRAQVQRQRRSGQRRARVREPGQERERIQRQGVEEVGERGRDLRRRGRQHPQPHRRRDRRRREQVRRQRDRRDAVEVMREQRRGAQRRRDGQRRGLGEAAGKAAPDQPVAERRGQGEDGDHRGERELPARVGHRPRVEQERHRRREQQRVPAR